MTVEPLPRATRWRRRAFRISGRARSFGRHRENDGLDPFELSLVNREIFQLIHAREHGKHIFQRADAA